MSYQLIFLGINCFAGSAVPGKHVSSLCSINSSNPFNGNGVISGSTANVGNPNYPVSRRVRLLHKGTGMIVRETWSDNNGDYSFIGIKMGDPFVIVAFDHTGKYNAVIADPIYASLPS